MTIDRAHLQRLITNATPGPLAVVTMPDGDPGAHFADAAARGDGPIYGVLAPTHPDASEKVAVVTCWTGNGPASAANAELYALAVNLAREVLRLDAEVAGLKSGRLVSAPRTRHG